MKKLVVYFSKTGNTRVIAEKIAKNLNADIDEIIDKEKNGEEKFFKVKNRKIDFKKNSSEYDLAIIGTPVWGFSASPIIKSYLYKNNLQDKKLAFFCTCGGIKGFTFIQMKKLSRKPLTTLRIKSSRLDNSDDAIKEFCNRLK